MNLQKNNKSEGYLLINNSEREVSDLGIMKIEWINTIYKRLIVALIAGSIIQLINKQFAMPLRFKWINIIPTAAFLFIVLTFIYALVSTFFNSKEKRNKREDILDD